MDRSLRPDIQLLAVEIDTLWTTDERGRLVRDRGLNGLPAPHVVIASSLEASIGAFGAEVPDHLATEISGLLGGAAVAAPGAPPAMLDDLRRRLEAAMGPIEVASGPGYAAEAAPATTSPAALISSGAAEPDEGALQAPELANWEPDEWRLLLDGSLGPWAAAIIDGETISLCFSARLTEQAAEAGVWTHPEHRGRGHAAAVTAAWVAQILASGRLAFYSTSAENLSSQRVAARLGLRPIGWMWHLRSPR